MVGFYGFEGGFSGGCEETGSTFDVPEDSVGMGTVGPVEGSVLLGG